MEPTEHEGTVAVDAAARVVYHAAVSPRSDAPAFDTLDPMVQNRFRESVTPLVWAALQALPDRAAR